MPSWLSYVLAIVALLTLAPLMAWVGHKHGRQIKGGVALASVLLGIGVIDPPAKQAIEANERRETDEDESSEPKKPRRKRSVSV